MIYDFFKCFFHKINKYNLYVECNLCLGGGGNTSKKNSKKYASRNIECNILVV